MSLPPPSDGETAPPLTSYEGRWFFPGVVPEALVRAFRGSTPGAAAGSRAAQGAGEAGEAEEAGGAGEAGGGRSRGEGSESRRWPPSRTDHYLPFTPDMGIKLRLEPGQPPRLEFKGRLRSNDRVALAPDVVTMASTWSKWSYPLDQLPVELRGVVEPGGASVPVEKSRLLRRYRLDPGAPAREVPLEERLERGVQLELTRLRIGLAGDEPGPWRGWTLGFEGFPLSDGLEEDVHAALSGLLAALAAAGAPLDEAHSASYPEWLGSLADRASASG